MCVNSKSEIVHIYKRFGELRDDNMSIEPVALSTIMEIPELRHNPFRERICEVRVVWWPCNCA